jgi:predicted glycosyltransferase
MTIRVLFYVQHLMGIGHQMRSAAVTRELVKEGFEVTYVSGGMPVPGLDLGGASFEQLPPCKSADSRFQTLVDETGNSIDAAWRETRKEVLLKLFTHVRPNILITETFPFGRRLMRFELDPLLIRAAQITPKPLIAASIRDILEPKSTPERYDEIADKIERWYDAILVHGDPNLVSLEATVPITEKFKSKIFYTGYVGERGISPKSEVGQGEVMVTAGSGRVGLALLENAMKARSLTELADVPWRILVGTGMAENQFHDLKAEAEKGIIVERHRTDYLSLLRNCEVSISRAGYNTVMDILIEKAHAVLVPFATPQETEQLVRARLLAERGLVQLVEEREMTPTTLAKAINSAYTAPAMEVKDLGVTGAAKTASLLSAIYRNGDTASNPGN